MQFAGFIRPFCLKHVLVCNLKHRILCSRKHIFTKLMFEVCPLVAVLMFFLPPAFLLPLSEKSTSPNKNPSKPPVISVPPKAPEDKTPNTHFGVVIHDRGWCRQNRRLSERPCVVAAAAGLCADNDCGMFLGKIMGLSVM